MLTSGYGGTGRRRFRDGEQTGRLSTRLPGIKLDLPADMNMIGREHSRGMIRNATSDSKKRATYPEILQEVGCYHLGNSSSAATLQFVLMQLLQQYTNRGTPPVSCSPSFPVFLLSPFFSPTYRLHLHPAVLSLFPPPPWVRSCRTALPMARA